MYRTIVCLDFEKMLPRFYVRNGATLNIAFGCYYLAEHDRWEHDHIGWPNPDNPDRICQILGSKFFNDRGQHAIIGEEIDLIDEGYTTATVTFEDAELAENLDWTAEIDEDNPYIVHLKADTNFDTFTGDPKELHFTLFVYGTGTTIDAVCHGIIVVMPGAPIGATS